MSVILFPTEGFTVAELRILGAVIDAAQRLDLGIEPFALPGRVHFGEHQLFLVHIGINAQQTVAALVYIKN